MNQQLAVSVGSGALRVLATGVLATLGTFQVSGRWTPALVAGGIAAASRLLGDLGVAGAAAKISAARSSGASQA